MLKLIKPQAIITICTHTEICVRNVLLTCSDKSRTQLKTFDMILNASGRIFLFQCDTSTFRGNEVIFQVFRYFYPFRISFALTYSNMNQQKAGCFYISQHAGVRN